MSACLLSQHQSGRKLPSEPLRRLVGRIRERLGHDDRQLELTLVGDEEMRDINRRFLGRNRSTNVISFEADEPDRLGSVVVNVDHAAREAAGNQTTLRFMVGFYVLHGILHLSGFDHERSGPDEAARMDQKQQDLQDLLEEYEALGKRS